MIDLKGQRFGRLLVTGKNIERSGQNTYWDYVCDCGAVGSTATAKLSAGQQSCGCHTHQRLAKLNLSHGHTVGGDSPTYRSYRAMIARVIYPSQDQWKHYGGRGIAICDRWIAGEHGLSGFECFLADMGARPVGMTIDREDVNGNYCPSNCRWATKKEQSRNMRSTRLTVVDASRIRQERASGASQNQLAAMFSVSRGTIRNVIDGKSWV